MFNKKIKIKITNLQIKNIKNTNNKNNKNNKNIKNKEINKVKIITVYHLGFQRELIKNLINYFLFLSNL